jgi:hypothetical protein
MKKGMNPRDLYSKRGSIEAMACCNGWREPWRDVEVRIRPSNQASELAAMGWREPWRDVKELSSWCVDKWPRRRVNEQHRTFF